MNIMDNSTNKMERISNMIKTWFNKKVNKKYVVESNVMYTLLSHNVIEYQSNTNNITKKFQSDITNVLDSRRAFYLLFSYLEYDDDFVYNFQQNIPIYITYSFLIPNYGFNHTFKISKSSLTLNKNNYYLVESKKFYSLIDLPETALVKTHKKKIST